MSGIERDILLTKMGLTVPLQYLLCFVLYALENQCSAAQPYVSFMDERLANHSYVHLSNGDCIQCHTDLSTCCSTMQGPDRGDWDYPDRSRVPFESAGKVIFERREPQRVDLCRDSGSSPQSGIYSCNIPTSSAGNSFVYVGVYGSSTGGKNYRTSRSNWEYSYRDILLKPVAIIIIHVSACLMYAYNFVVFLG